MTTYLRTVPVRTTNQECTHAKDGALTSQEFGSHSTPFEGPRTMLFRRPRPKFLSTWEIGWLEESVQSQTPACLLCSKPRAWISRERCHISSGRQSTLRQSTWWPQQKGVMELLFWNLIFWNHLWICRRSIKQGATTACNFWSLPRWLHTRFSEPTHTRPSGVAKHWSSSCSISRLFDFFQRHLLSSDSFLWLFPPLLHLSILSGSFISKLPSIRYPCLCLCSSLATSFFSAKIHKIADKHW